MLILKNILTLFLVFLVATTYGQEKNIIFDHLSTSDGLPQNSIFCILQDNKGFMWFGTEDGLARYDGHTFQSYKHIPGDTTSLSENAIRSICQDKQGYIWIGTHGGGLNKFDPATEKFVAFKNDPNNPNSLSENRIFSLAIDSKGVLWVGTLEEGLNKVIIDSDNPEENPIFIRYQHDPDNPFSLSDDKIYAIYEDHDGVLWIGTFAGGLNKMVPEENDSSKIKFIHYKHDTRNPNSISNNSVRSIYQDHSGNMWFGTEAGGLNKLIPGSEAENSPAFIRYQHDPLNPFSLSNNDVTSILEDKEGRIWVGSLGGGLNQLVIDPFDSVSHDQRDLSPRFIRYKDDPANPNSLQGNFVFTLYQDRSGILWIGMTSGGINKIEPERQNFDHYRPNEYDRNNFRGKLVKSIYEDRSGILWIGTFGGGLSRFDRENQKFENYANVPGDANSLSYDYVQTIYEDSKGNLWIGTDGGGLNKFDRDNHKFIRYSSDPDDPGSLRSDRIWTILEDKNKVLWLGTAEGGGLSMLKAVDNGGKLEFVHYHNDPNDPGSLSYNDVRTIYEDKSGILWVGTYGGGLNQFDRDTEKFKIYRNDPDDSLSLSHDIITTIYQDGSGTLWIGTYGGGLNKATFHEGNLVFKDYGEKEGLANNVIKSILEDDAGNLWVSTVKGITKFDPENEIFQNFTKSDGLQEDEFNLGTSCKTKDGEMFFGGVNGFNAFYPEKIKENDYLPAVVITDLRISNVSVSPGDLVNGKEILKNAIGETEKITLGQKENVFLFEFSALAFSSQDKIRYAYKMEPIDLDWTYTDPERRFAPYSNLRPGEYMFQVKATNSDGKWSDSMASIQVVILPPWWKTWWAYTGYGIIIAAILFISRGITRSRIKLKNDLKIERLEKEKVQEVNRMKLRFFTNISHEFRTPLTLILGPLGNLITTPEVSKNVKKQLLVMHRNANRLLGLINQLMDFRKQETGSVELKVAKGNIVKFIREVKLSFNDLAKQRNILFNFHTESPEIEVWFDRDQFEKVIFNLLSNAFKFTPDGGNISVSVATGSINTLISSGKNDQSNGQDHALWEFVEVLVSDNGKGIPQENINQIFERFYQVEESENSGLSGTGIGLALTKGLVELHKGQVLVESETGKGTCFKVRIPMGKEHFKPDQIIKDFKNSEDSQHYRLELIEQSDLNMMEESESLIEENSAGKPTILIVEDNEDVLAYIKESLNALYNIIEAGNGKEGLEKAIDIVPELIISDIMMPEMDGIELCGLLKTNIATSHIPVILLTARTSLIYRIEGFETGADDYINKPFHFGLLKVRVKNLIESRRKLRERFSREINLEPKEVTITSPDELMLQKAVEIVEEYMSDPEFDVNTLVREIGLSRSVLYKKLPALTNYSPNEFIHVVRLKRAAQILIQNKLTVAEVCYEVGFKTPRYFSKCFRKQFGMTPSEYAGLHTDKTLHE